ncbi:MAG: MJ0042-type zinc finger domain-containing protein [Planctomycetota bacterium]
MKTQCPGCKAKFTVGQGNIGKKAKCPKCSQPFTIEALAEAAVEAPAKSSEPEKKADEVCSQCRVTIGQKQKAYIYKANIVCGRCYNRMMGAEQQAPSPSEPEEEPQSKNISKILYVYSWAVVRIIAGIICVLGLALIIKRADKSIVTATFAAGDFFLVCSVLIEIVLYYRMWAAIQDDTASIGPVKAAGFLFIPVFNVYWALYMIVGFAEDYNDFVRRYSIKTKDLSVGLFLAYAAAFLLSSVTITVPMIFIFKFFWAVRPAFTKYSHVSWPLFSVVLAIGISHFITYIMVAAKACKAINALPRD